MGAVVTVANNAPPTAAPDIRPYKKGILFSDNDGE